MFHPSILPDSNHHCFTEWISSKNEIRSISCLNAVQTTFPLFQLIAISMAAHMALAGARVTTSLYVLSLQASELTVGILIALFAFFPMLFAVAMGRLIDRTGIKRPMLYSCFAIAVGCALPSLIGGLPGRGRAGGRGGAGGGAGRGGARRAGGAGS